MSNQQEPNWVDLLSTAKSIRRSVRPVSPSTRFRDGLRSDLALRLDDSRPSRGLTIGDSGRMSPLLVIGLCLGLFLTGMAFRLLHSGAASTKP